MDISETYIKMCEKAEEIQGQVEYYNNRPQFPPRSYWWCEVQSPLNGRGLNMMIREGDYPVKYIWLPRQDQLQEMMIVDHPYTPLQLIGIFVDFLTVNNLRYLTGNASMEQLWLAFVMKEKYNKLWGGKEWING